mgnify:CR=1 FL=1
MKLKDLTNSVDKTGCKTGIKYLALLVSSLCTMSVSQADVSKKKIGDLEIYQEATGGKVTIIMMLDTSGSMSEPYMQDASACDLPFHTNYTPSPTTSTTTPSYTRYSCTTEDKEYKWYQSGTKFYKCDNTFCSSWGGDGDYTNVDVSSYTKERIAHSKYKYYVSKTSTYPDRITRLKDAIFNLMDSKDANGNYLLDSNKVAIGIGQFSSQSGSDNVFTSADGRSGKILVPAALLSDTQRTAIKTAVANLQAGNGTPSAAAYAEAGAYMLGTTTYNTTTKNWGTTGTAKSFTTSKTSSTSNTYLSPLDANAASCDGQGVYFLTDGEPNSAKTFPQKSFTADPTVNMALALGAYSFSATNGLPETDTAAGTDSGWQAIGAFAKALRTTTSNPKAKSIRTAVVGFGSVFDTSNYPNIIQTLRNPILDSVTSLPKKNADGTYQYKNSSSDYFDCSQIPTTKADARNACNWGAKSHPALSGVGGYGEGGFYSAQSTDDVVNSVTKFLGDLNNEIPAAPSGVMAVPQDPYKSIGEMPYAFVPTVEARVSGTAGTSNIWPGNVKKYNLLNGTLIGQNNAKLFRDVAGNLNTSTQDLWSNANYQTNSTDANDNVKAGGVYNNLKSPNTAVNDTRTVMVEDTTATNVTTTKFVSLSVDATGKPIGFDTINDQTTYTRGNKIKLLQFLGFSSATYNGVTKQLSDPSSACVTAPANTAATVCNDWEHSNTPYIKDLVMVKPTNEQKVLGASIHSKPVAISYGANLDSNGQVTASTRNDQIFFGSMDGALHLVGAKDYAGSTDGGRESLAFIPRIMIKNQPEALVPNSTYTVSTSRPTGVPKFGIDGDWLVKTYYKYDYDNNKVAIDSTKGGVLAYGGMRLGGKGLLALDLTDPTTPKKAFTNRDTALIDNTTTGFSNIGYIWNKPTFAKIKTSSTDTVGKDVIIFGGGYDMCYENENFQIGVAATTANGIDSTCASKTAADGNAVYIVDAKTGDLIWSVSNTGASLNDANIKNSVVGGVVALDRDNDGFIDHLYFDDLGGQVFRVDFKDGLIGGSNVGRVTRILKDKDADSTNTIIYTRRFYEAPVVSVHRNTRETTGTATHGDDKLFMLVNVISGDRSSPLSKIRTDKSKADRLYGIIDTDVVKLNANLYPSSGSFTATIKDLTIDNLISLPSTNAKQISINTLKDYTSKGWYYPLSLFDGYDNVRYSKGMGRSDIFAGYLYTTVYNPDMQYGKGDPCTAKIVGGTEREVYCLPYGICKDSLSINGTGGYIRAGQGIQELNFGPVSKDLLNRRMLISTLDYNDRLNVLNRTNGGSDSNKHLINTGTSTSGGSTTGSTLSNADIGLSDSNDAVATSSPGTTEILMQTGGSHSTGEYFEEPRYVLKPNQWYEVQ